MANPLKDEDAIYQMIQEKKIQVDPIVWELINHHVRNDLNLISLGISSLRLHPLWILKAANGLIKLLYKISFQPGKPEDLLRTLDKGLLGIKNIDMFLRKLKRATYKA